jgi:hypothetical protein
MTDFNKVALATLALLACWATYLVPVASAAGPVLVLGQGQLNASSSIMSNANIAEWGIFVGNGYSGKLGTIVEAVGPITSNGTGGWAGSFVGEVDQSSTTNNPYYIDASCGFAAQNSGSVVTNGDVNFVTLAQTTEFNGGCTLRPDLYTRVIVGIPFGHFVNSSWVDYYFGSVTNNKGYHWSSTFNSALDCGWSNTDPNSVPCRTDFFPYFSVTGGSFSLVPTTTSSGVFFSGAQAFCNAAFASSSGIGAEFSNALCIAGGFLFIPTSDSLAAFQNIPAVIGSSFPFAYITQIRTILAAAQASSSQNFINLTLPFGTSTQILGINNLAVISTSTFSKYVSDSQRNSMRDLLAAVFYLSAAAFIYREIQRVWQTT